MSRKKEIRALCSLAPLPLYTGKPAPVILLPNSKSIISYFLASSQLRVNLDLFIFLVDFL